MPDRFPRDSMVLLYLLLYVGLMGLSVLAFPKIYRPSSEDSAFRAPPRDSSSLGQSYSERKVTLQSSHEHALNGKHPTLE
jgi:hypothetical protein